MQLTNRKVNIRLCNTTLLVFFGISVAISLLEHFALNGFGRTAKNLGPGTEAADGGFATVKIKTD